MSLSLKRNVVQEVIVMSYASSSTNRLLMLARNGDGDSLGLLLRKYFRYLNSLSRGHIDDRIRVRISASDVVQETLLEAHRDFPDFIGTSVEEFTGWLRRILFNNLARALEVHVLAAKRDVRKQRSIEHHENPNQSTVGLVGALEGNLTSVSAALHQEDLLKDLTLAINQLPEDYRRVIQLRNFENLSFNQIAERLGRNPGATRMLWVRAVEKLKRFMPPKDG